MSFREKSAWVMLVALLATGLFYFWSVLSLTFGSLISPEVPFLIVYTVALTIIATLSHITAALFSIRDANTSKDERERIIFTRAGHLSGSAFGVGIILSLGGISFIRMGPCFFTVFLGVWL